MPYIDADALNYPYIRVRDVDWLKRTLLLFPTVVRMTPFQDAPADDPDVHPFTQTFGRHGPLLRSAQISAPHVERAQRDLIRQLEVLRSTSADDLVERYGCASVRRSGAGGLASARPTVWERRLTPGGSFQIHRYKMHQRLACYLEEHDLAWPAHADPDGPNYLEMHPHLGEAVMATMAMACAENEGLRVVTEFPQLHGRLIGTPRDQILNACLGEGLLLPPDRAQTAAEILVYRRCDVSAMTAERIAALKSERDALAAFRVQLEHLVSTIPPVIEDSHQLEMRVNDTLNDMFRDWRADQANLSNYSRRLFGEGVLQEPGKLIEKLVEAAAKPEASVTTTVGAASGVASAPLVGGLTMGIAAGAAAGFAIALVFRGIRVWSETKAHEAASPYRYLTSLAQEGVTFSMSR